MWRKYVCFAKTSSLGHIIGLSNKIKSHTGLWEDFYLKVWGLLLEIKKLLLIMLVFMLVCNQGY